MKLHSAGFMGTIVFIKLFILLLQADARMGTPSVLSLPKPQRPVLLSEGMAHEGTCKNIPGKEIRPSVKLVSVLGRREANNIISRCINDYQIKFGDAQTVVQKTKFLSEKEF